MEGKSDIFFKLFRLGLHCLLPSQPSAHLAGGRSEHHHHHHHHYHLHHRQRHHEQHFQDEHLRLHFYTLNQVFR